MKSVIILVPWLVGHGQERMAALTANYLQKEYNVTIVVFDDSIVEYSINCPIVSLKTKKRKGIFGKVFNVFLRSQKLKKIRKAKKPSAVISFGTSSNIVNVLSKGIGKSIISFRGYESVKNDLVNKLCCSKADFIFGICKDMAFDLKKIFPKQSNKINYIYNAVDVDLINIKKQERITDFVKKNYTIVSVGRLEHVKGYFHLINSFALFKQDYKYDSTLLIIGDGSIKNELVVKTKELGLFDSVVFLGKKSNPFPYIAMSDLCVQASINEGFMNVLVEAGACGLPIISTNCKAGPSEIITGDVLHNFDNDIVFSKYGILVPSFSSDFSKEDEKERILADAMLYLSNDADLRKEYAFKAFNRSKDFSPELYINKIKSLFEE